MFGEYCGEMGQIKHSEELRTGHVVQVKHTLSHLKGYCDNTTKT
uniref:Uncharacterized protein n=1 Tax=Anguilla anguilla TaxID=7936 RepID=A0A0E9PB58_ANGAN